MRSILCWLLLACAAWAEPVAVVLHVEGPVEIEVSPKSRPLRMARRLEPGDVLKLPAKSRVVVGLYAGGESEAVGPLRVKVTSTGLEPSQGTGKVQRYEPPRVVLQGTEADREAGGMVVRSAKVDLANFPELGARWTYPVISGQAVGWPAYPLATYYEVRYGDQRFTVATNQAVLEGVAPESAVTLEVTPLASDKQPLGAPLRLNLRVLGSEPAARVRELSRAGRLAPEQVMRAATGFEQAGMPAAALELYEWLLLLEPENVELLRSAADQAALCGRNFRSRALELRAEQLESPAPR